MYTYAVSAMEKLHIYDEDKENTIPKTSGRIGFLKIIFFYQYFVRK